MQNPGSITGGCNCGGVRYRVDFAPDHDWKRGPRTCQCTQCRKMCGSLVLNLHEVQISELTWLNKITYAEYNSSAQNFRAFCKNCGSSIAWIDRSVSKEIELAVGAFDEEFLVGARDDEDRPLGAYGVALANPKGNQYYIRNEIQGVTDTDLSHKGARFLEGEQGRRAAEQDRILTQRLYLVL
ncbi:Mss4-like protein [Mycena venus]|uniref:Mss4-like protein n=1 Tax=Mycena venus TaxID=2733690 RepID=A0A8H6Y3Z1_9AGAR|nr:Mss4-like protein [Mycena venus]